MEDICIIKELKKAIKDVYKDSEGYFCPTKGRERSMVFRIAHHLANQIETKTDIFVDIEATRCNGRTKRGDCEAIVKPDLIVHKRGGHGLLVAEFKCDRSSAKKNYDCAKLEFFTMDKRQSKYMKLSCPTYDLGAFVYLGNSLSDVEITLFANGRPQEVIKGL